MQKSAGFTAPAHTPACISHGGRLRPGSSASIRPSQSSSTPSPVEGSRPLQTSSGASWHWSQLGKLLQSA
jgi:hypothetical protein